MTSDPRTAIEAVTHPDPYPWYSRVVRERPIAFDDELGCWVAASAAAVTAVLEAQACRVRPGNEPVPNAISGTAAGDVFRHLVRMNDGERHCPLKRAISASLDSCDARVVREAALASMGPIEETTGAGPDSLHSIAYRLPVYALGSILGLNRDSLETTAGRVGEFVAVISPGASAEALERGALSAARLMESMLQRLDVAPMNAGGLLGELAGAADRFGVTSREVIAANAVGFLSQSYEATAGTIGNAIIALARHPAVAVSLLNRPELVRPFVSEVLRYDPPVQNTRRYVCEEALVAECSMKSGDTILVLLGAANRDPRANRQPDRFDIDRTVRKHFTFGVGAHGCPGAAMASTLAEVVVEWILERELDLEAFAGPVAYRKSANVRIPVLEPFAVASEAHR